MMMLEEQQRGQLAPPPQMRQLPHSAADDARQ